MAYALSRQVSEPVFYQSEALLEASDGHCFHGFFGRRGGVSKDVYSSLNCGAGSDDLPENVQHNKAIIADIAGVPSENLLTLYQVHGTTCVSVSEAWEVVDRPHADAMVTDVAGLALGGLTADCAPVLFYAETDQGKPVIGVAHAGWRGAFDGVLEATVDALMAYNVQPGDIKAAIGPCIQQRSYEVDGVFFKTFVERDDQNEKFFKTAQKPGHYLFDLAGYCAFRLFQKGLSHVQIKDLDTYFNEEDFFSYRRATHRDEKDYGRQMSTIVIK